MATGAGSADNATEVYGGVVVLLTVIGKVYTEWQKRKGEHEQKPSDHCAECKQDLKEARERNDQLEEKLAAREKAHDEDRERWIARYESAESGQRKLSVELNDMTIDRDRWEARAESCGWKP